MAKKQKNWKIMVYLAGNNNLAEEMVFALREMYRVGSRSDFDLVVQFDTGGPPRRFHVTPNPLNHVAGDVLKPYEPAKEEAIREALAASRTESRAREDQDFHHVGTEVHRIRQEGGIENAELKATREILLDFLAYSLKEPDAEHYMLILSGHGSGAVGDFLGGDNPTSRLGIRDLSWVFDELKKRFKIETCIDILGMDSCLMSMAEVAYEVAEYVHFLVGAEGFESNNGWPYARLLELLLAERQPLNLEPAELAKAVVRAYTVYYENYTLVDLSTDLAALNLEALKQNLIPKFKKLSNMMRERMQVCKDMGRPDAVRDAILLSHWEAQSYKDEQYTDLWDFCDLLAKRCGKIDEKDVPIDKKDVPIDQDLAQACVEVQNAISSKEQDKGTVMLSGYCGAAFQYSYGLSVFFPWANMKDAAGTSDLDAYKKLKFCGGTDWDRFLSAYLSNTQRSPRDAGRKQHLKYKNRRIFLNPSRLDQRPGIYTTLALTGKGNPPDDKGNPPDDKFGLSKMGYMKNPPTDWYPCDLIVEELLTKGMVIEKPAVDDDRPAK